MIDAVLTWLLFRTRLFERAGLIKTAEAGTRVKLDYYASCPNCGSPRQGNDKVCRYCGSSMIRSEETSNGSDPT